MTRSRAKPNRSRVDERVLKSGVTDRARPVAREIELSPTFTLMLSDGRGTAIDSVDAVLLKKIQENNSITMAAEATGISYRNAWDRIDRIGKKLGRPVVLAERGGRKGGSARLSQEGMALLKDYIRLSTYLLGALDDRDFWQHLGYRLSARNRVKARITEVEPGPVASAIKMEIHSNGRLTSIISNEAVQDLDLKAGDEVEAVIKATEVIIAKRTGGAERD